MEWLVNDEVWHSEEMKEPDDVTKVTLRVTELGRRHLHAVFECRATNFNDSSPISATVTLDMNCEWQARLSSLTLHVIWLPAESHHSCSSCYCAWQTQRQLIIFFLFRSSPRKRDWHGIKEEVKCLCFLIIQWGCHYTTLLITSETCILGNMNVRMRKAARTHVVCAW